MRCACGETFVSADALDDHLIGVVFAPGTDTGEDGREHYEVSERGRAPVLARGRVDTRVAWGIRRLRLERRWSQAQVARLLGCHISRVSRIESGERGTPSPTVIAELLGTTVGYLLMPCPDCGGKPPCGYQCLRCGTRTWRTS
jgi:hypothetical protein